MEDKNGLAKLDLDQKQELLVQDIINEDNVDNTKAMIDLFNLNIVKKNVVRVNKLNHLLDKINDQAIERFEKRPEEINNKDLLDYMNTVQNQIEKSTNTVKTLENKPTVQLNQQNNVSVNINNSDTVLNKESRDNIINTIQEILKEAKKEQNTIEDNIVDVKID